MVSEIIKLAWQNIKANLLRAILTLVIIAFGITALVGILTAIDSAIYSMGANFSTLGANSFSISPRWVEIESTVRGEKQKRSEPITYREAMEFKDNYDHSDARVAVSYDATNSATVKYKNEQTSPTTGIYGVDENELIVRSRELEEGRFFTAPEIHSADHKAVVGSAIVDQLFDENHKQAVGSTILINGRKYKVIGTLKSQGASINESTDRIVFIPVTNARMIYAGERSNFAITIGVPNSSEVEDAVSAATGVMRNARRLTFAEQNDFVIEKSNNLVETLEENTSNLRLAAVFIALITLIGAAIGLMNIMLVSVTERTKEIGIIKAIGATRANIVMQFLVEAIMICQMGGVVGIVLGIGIGIFVTNLLGGTFVIPWAWIILGIVTCTIVGLVAGIYPAMKASRLDPIEALRYE